MRNLILILGILFLSVGAQASEEGSFIELKGKKAKAFHRVLSAYAEIDCGSSCSYELYDVNCVKLFNNVSCEARLTSKNKMGYIDFSGEEALWNEISKYGQLKCSKKDNLCKLDMTYVECSVNFFRKRCTIELTD